MKKLLATIVLIVVILGAGVFYYHSEQHVMPTFQASNKVLQDLKDGNARFVSGKPRHHDYEKQIRDTKKTQTPKVIVLSCSDSRSIPELAFDQGIGSIFTIRVAGNVINKDVLGSMEYAADVIGAKLIVVLGHTNCGAMAAACKDVKFGNLTGLLQQIQPAVQTAKTATPSGGCKDKNFVDAIAKQNVINMIQQIPQKSSIIARLVKVKKVKIVGGIYDVSTGKVTFFDTQAKELSTQAAVPSEK